MEKLQAISPLDGRYASKTLGLRSFFSEEALISFRLKIEAEYLIFLTDFLKSKKQKTPCLTSKQKEELRLFCQDSLQNALTVKNIEFSGHNGIPATNHDVKAVEYHLRTFIKSKKWKELESYVHFGLTSEDINNICYCVMTAMAFKNEIFPNLKLIKGKLSQLAFKHSDTLLLARTHGQPAVGTTFGKEFKVFEERLSNALKNSEQINLKAKLNGAVGNYNALYSAYPQIDWRDFSKKFINHIASFFKVRIEANLFTTQIESHDSFAEFFDSLVRLNTILIGLNQDLWRYISDELIIQKRIDSEVGSSTMPHKVNPIDFENSEGNLGISNALLSFFSKKLPISRLQRDLSDSTVQRNIGVAMAYASIAHQSLLSGLGKIEINEKKAKESLQIHPEIYAEAVQTILKKYNYPNPYEELKKFSRGKTITLAKLKKFVKNLKISPKTAKEILATLNKPYIGIAPDLARKKQ